MIGELGSFSREAVEGAVGRLNEWGIESPTKEMVWFYMRYSQMIGQVLNKLESSISNDRQWQALRRDVNKPQYDFLKYFLYAMPSPYGLGLEEKELKLF